MLQGCKRRPGRDFPWLRVALHNGRLWQGRGRTSLRSSQRCRIWKGAAGLPLRLTWGRRSLGAGGERLGLLPQSWRISLPREGPWVPRGSDPLRGHPDPSKAVLGAPLAPCSGSGSPGKRRPAVGREATCPRSRLRRGPRLVLKQSWERNSTNQPGATLPPPCPPLPPDSSRAPAAPTEPGWDHGETSPAPAPGRSKGARGPGRGLGAAGGAGEGTKEPFGAAVNGSLTSDLSVWVLASCWAGGRISG